MSHYLYLKYDFVYRMLYETQTHGGCQQHRKLFIVISVSYCLSRVVLIGLTLNLLLKLYYLKNGKPQTNLE